MKNVSNGEKTIKSMMQYLTADTWSVDKFILYGNYNNEANLIVGNILDNYRDYFEQYLEEIDLDEKYYYQPAYFAEDYYGTPDLDFLVMYFAAIPTLFEFNVEKIKVLPKTRMTEITKLMNKYKDIVDDSYINPTEFLKSE